MIDRDALSRDHRELGELVTRLLEQIWSPDPDRSAIPALRWELSRKLAIHLAKEDSLLYPHLQASPDLKVAATAKRFAQEMGGLAAAYQHYMVEWTPDRTASEWTGFRDATETVMAALKQRIQREELELYVLVRTPAITIGFTRSQMPCASPLTEHPRSQSRSQTERGGAHCSPS